MDQFASSAWIRRVKPQRNAEPRGQTMIIIELFAGIILIAIASIVFWKVGNENFISRRWRNSLGLESLLVFVVLGGWAGGASCIIHSLAMMFSS